MSTTVIKMHNFLKKLGNFIRKTTGIKKISQEQRVVLFTTLEQIQNLNKISRGIHFVNLSHVRHVSDIIPSARGFHRQINKDGFRKIIERKLITCLKGNYPWVMSERYFAIWFKLAQEKKSKNRPSLQYQLNSNFHHSRSSLPNLEPFKRSFHKQPKGILATNLIQDTKKDTEQPKDQDVMNEEASPPAKKGHLSDTDIARKVKEDQFKTEKVEFKVSLSDTGLTKVKNAHSSTKRTLFYEIDEEAKRLIKKLKNDRTLAADRPKASKNKIDLISREDFQKTLQENKISTIVKESTGADGEQEIRIIITLER